MADRQIRDPASPVVSVCVASFNCERHLGAALSSALGQTLSDIEVIVVDDGSSDGSVQIAREMASKDARVRVEVLPQNLGPGGARNHAIEVARGRWFAVLDSDDLYHPERLARLVAHAEAEDADAVADDLLLFFEGGPSSSRRRFLKGSRSRAPGWIGPEDYFDETRMFEGGPNLGFLKPVIAMDFLRRTGVRYDPSMRIGEDDDLIVRLLRAGLRYRLVPQITYFYRKHDQSISHRIGTGHLDQMIERSAVLRRQWADAPAAVRRALGRREASFHRALAFVRMVEAVKAKRPLTALGLAIRHPSALRHFGMPIMARLARWLPQPKLVAPDPRAVAIVSRQRVIGRTNGSSVYLLSLVAEMEKCGFEPHLIWPSPHVFGRWPVLPLQPEMAVFRSIRVRGGVRAGSMIFSTDPRRYWSAATAAGGAVLAKLRLPSRWLAGDKAPYAIAAPWTDVDRLFVARNAPEHPAAAIADYGFLTEAFPYLVAPGTPTAVVMHDLFHARAGSLGARRASDDVAVVTEEEEKAMLARADVVIAIQDEEAGWVRQAAPDTRVIVAPMAAEPVAGPQPGADGLALFVGSATHPNVVGLEWLFAEVWPKVRAALPEARLVVAGGVGRAFSAPPPGVTFVGMAPDLAPLYAEAGVLISPLIVGSGLKIKLIEALAAGKASVVTSVTLQGVEDLAREVRLADDPDAFAAAMIELMHDRAERERLGEAALNVARRRFSAEAAYADFRNWLTSPDPDRFDAGISGGIDGPGGDARRTALAGH